MTKIIDQLNYSESHTGNLTSMSKDRVFKSLFLENYSSFILTIECKEEFTLQGELSGHNQGKIAKKPRENICLSLHMSVLSFIFNKKLLL